ncbi:hypothetical protein [Alteromonas lipolytica]|uniref:Rap1a immunity protein domain-containing protein n=1 Tax=Alteromonas lipolytica TaxID=1856405 RepID=A0A1E8FIH9_9ALTE|nr:hypothetical protein [Alteromonas lipolytica]OFI35757.1 hypothetical protein BFC17_10750 [Alteromonas lipolytica]GGF80509.1 hypothetical protein GCM10011338_35970 [Alteromonas lipolytica]
MKTLTKCAAVIIIAFAALPATAQSRIPSHDLMALCQGLGQAVTSVSQGREQRIDDEQNEGIQVLKRLSAHSGTDFITPITTFLQRADSLPFLVQGMLYTHACWHSYQDNPAKVSLMASLLPYRCDLSSPTMACIDRAFLTLPQQAEPI